MELLTEKKLRFLEERALAIRRTIIEELVAAGSGHSAGPLGMADVFAALYFYILRHDPKRPDWEARDRLILSNGHICPVQYATLAHAGYFPLSELKTLRKIDSRLQGHPHRGSVPGLETTSGPLGTGLSQAIGVALAGYMNRQTYFTYVLTSDGEHEEGNHWEAVMFAGKHGYDLHRLIMFVDRNNIQIDGCTEDVMPLEPLADKYKAFGWHVIEIDGHNLEAIVSAAYAAQSIYEAPSVIITHTIPGKGVSFMEHNYLWHGKAPTKEEAARALEELHL